MYLVTLRVFLVHNRVCVLVQRCAASNEQDQLAYYGAATITTHPRLWTYIRCTL